MDGKFESQSKHLPPIADAFQPINFRGETLQVLLLYFVTAK